MLQQLNKRTEHNRSDHATELKVSGVAPAAQIGCVILSTQHNPVHSNILYLIIPMSQCSRQAWLDSTSLLQEGPPGFIIGKRVVLCSSLTDTQAV